MTQAFADVATVRVVYHHRAVRAETLNEQLQHALVSRIVIEQAKGFLAERLADVAQDVPSETLSVGAIDEP